MILETEVIKFGKEKSGSGYGSGGYIDRNYFFKCA